MKKRIIVPVLIIIFSFGGITRIEGSDTIRPILLVSILVIGIWIGILIKGIIEIYNDKKSNG